MKHLNLSSAALLGSGLSPTELKELTVVARRAASAGGTVLRHHSGRLERIREKSRAGDLVTEADEAAEAAVLAVLEAETPGLAILAEESGRRPGAGPRTAPHDRELSPDSELPVIFPKCGFRRCQRRSAPRGRRQP